MTKRKPKRKPLSSRRRNRDANNNANWKIVCSICGDEFLDIEQIDLVDGHWKQEHADHEDGKPHINLVWVGIGPAPKGRK